MNATDSIGDITMSTMRPGRMALMKNSQTGEGALFMIVPREIWNALSTGGDTAQQLKTKLLKATMTYGSTMVGVAGVDGDAVVMDLSNGRRLTLPLAVDGSDGWTIEAAAVSTSGLRYDKRWFDSLLKAIRTTTA